MTDNHSTSTPGTDASVPTDAIKTETARTPDGTTVTTAVSGESVGAPAGRKLPAKINTTVQLPALTVRNIIIAVAIAVVGVLFVVRFDDVMAIVTTAVHVIRPFIWGIAVAYLVNLVMKLWERIYFPRSTKKIVLKSRRLVCLLLALATIIGIFAGVIYLLAGEISHSFSALAAGFSQLGHAIYDFFAQDPAMSAWLSSESVNIENAVQSALSALGGWRGVMGSVVEVGGNAASVAMSVLIAVIFAMYLLMGKERIIAATKSAAETVLPAGAYKRVYHFGTVANDCFSRFITGQCIEALILGSLCAIGMKILGLPYSGTIGLCVGLTSLIPFIGAWIGGIVGALIISSISFMQALYFIIFLVILQQIEGHLIYPNVVGAAVEMPGIWTFVAVIAGGSLFGLPGVLLGVPIVSTARKLILEWKANRDRKLAEAAKSGTPADAS